MAEAGITETSGIVTVLRATGTSTPIIADGNEFFNPTDDPMFVGNNENIGASLVSTKLINADNFIPWRSSMVRSLSIKAKLGFAQGLFTKPTNDPYKLARWERCNGVILAWIINSVSDEIASSLVHSVSCVQAWTNLQNRFGGDNNMREYSISKEINQLMQGLNTGNAVENQLPGELDGSPSQLSQVQDQLSKLLSLFNQQGKNDDKQFRMAGPSQANYPWDW